MHTPTPYTANIADTRELEPGKYLREVLISGPHFTPEEIGMAAADAAFIRRACNMHEELLEALKVARLHIRQDAEWSQTVGQRQAANRVLDEIAPAIAKANE